VECVAVAGHEIALAVLDGSRRSLARRCSRRSRTVRDGGRDGWDVGCVASRTPREYNRLQGAYFMNWNHRQIGHGWNENHISPLRDRGAHTLWWHRASDSVASLPDLCLGWPNLY
jgi:hypothetical protein